MIRFHNFGYEFVLRINWKLPGAEDTSFRCEICLKRPPGLFFYYHEHWEWVKKAYVKNDYDDIPF